ncbi:hypothetical protein BDV96DRAFT_655234 [Lophiotrema nucula]|uniref:Uncharacterized protein n=1 Tax=Lophiotrema nucula TaxID=690887 RepID=A0A6A5YIA4_9PLEO|nr:hypothetical protein BDV96DRAFT_655234 [Lophiotrema nucula]
MLSTTILISILTTLTAAVAVPASPAPLAVRDGEYIYWKYYGDGGCHGNWIDDNAIGQFGTTGCVPITPITGANSFFVEHNDLTKKIRFYSQPGCTGNYVEVPAGTTGCYAQIVRSAQFV